MPAPLDLDPDPLKPFSAKNALYLAVASNIAYNPIVGDDTTATAQQFANELGLTDGFEYFNIRHGAVLGNNRTFVDIDTQAFAIACDTHAVVAFRGTQPKEWNDWMTDLCAVPAQFRYFFPNSDQVGNVHSGFSLALCDSWDPLAKWIRKYCCGARKRPVWFTGHSLGGAIAGLAAAACNFVGPRPTIGGIYTYGQPRFGQHDFCVKYDYALGKRHFRFVNRRDLVPRVPFRGWDYADCGQMIHFDDNGTPNKESSAWNNFLARNIDSFAQFFQIATHPKTDIEDHTLRTDGKGITNLNDTGPSYIGTIRRNFAALAALTF